MQILEIALYTDCKTQQHRQATDCRARKFYVIRCFESETSSWKKFFNNRVFFHVYFPFSREKDEKLSRAESFAPCSKVVNMSCFIKCGTLCTLIDAGVWEQLWSDSYPWSRLQQFPSCIFWLTPRQIVVLISGKRRRKSLKLLENYNNSGYTDERWI